MKKYNSILKSLETRLGQEINSRRYSLSDLISESYKSFYDCEEGTTLKRLAEAHLQDVRENPTDIERLSRQLSTLNQAIKMVEAKEISDDDIDEVPERRPTRVKRATKVNESPKCPDCGKDPCECEDIDEADDVELTDEEVDELAKHLDTIRKERKNPTSTTKNEAATPRKSLRTPKEEMKEFKKKGLDEARYGSGEMTISDMRNLVSTLEDIVSELESRDRDSIRLEPNTYGIQTPFLGTTEGYLSLADPYGLFADEDDDEYYESKKVETDEVKGSKSWSDIKEGLKNFSEASSSKAFYKTFKKLQGKLQEGTALTRQESINLYKAANSAMTHFSVELEHNPDFLSTFKEATQLLSSDVSKLLESMKNDKAPSKKTMKSLAKFTEALLEGANDEEDDIDEGIFGSSKKKQEKEKGYDGEIKKLYNEDSSSLSRKVASYIESIIYDSLESQKSVDAKRVIREKIKVTANELKRSPEKTIREIIKFGEQYAPTCPAVDDLNEFYSQVSKLRHVQDGLKAVEYLLGKVNNEVLRKFELLKNKLRKNESLNINEADEEDDDIPPIEDEEFVGDEEGDIASEESEEFDQEYADARVDLHKELTAEHADSEDPEVQEKLAQDAEEVVNLPGISEEQVAEIEGGAPEEGEEIPDEKASEEEEKESVDSEEDITDDELAELKKHLKEMRKARK